MLDKNIHIENQTPQLSLSKETIRSICGLGRGADCCKYLAAGMNGFECLKLNPELKRHIDNSNLNAKGDNCPGITMIGYKVSLN